LLDAALPNEKQNTAGEVLSDAVADAVDWPYALDRLLEASADPNHTNESGKTPLMVAAHLDRPDAIRRLLKAGAQINAVTIDPAIGGFEGPERTGRTALIYAAENASPIAIRLLLDAGADPTIKDSKGNDLSFYLARNQRLTVTERSLGVIAITDVASRFSGPSYSCSKATTATEKAICGSEVLRIFDSQIARAFTTLRMKAGTVVVREQRAWLQSRDLSCLTDVDCLAEKMSSHLRYLQKRLDE
jgi:uncharacterized protein YecT (DUF1311 family)